MSQHQACYNYIMYLSMEGERLSIQELDPAFRELLGGCVGLVACMVFYLVWWCITFKPGASATRFGTTCIILAVIVGIVGLFFMIRGLGSIKLQMETIANWKIAVGGIVAYIVLLALTFLLLKRQVTTELLLITGWAVLGLCIVNTLYGSGIYTQTLSMALVIILAIVVVANLVCYLLYYPLGGFAGYIVGMVPLAADAIYLLIIIGTVLANVSKLP